MLEELLVLLGELVDPRHQRQHQPLQAFGVERIDLLRWPPEGESDRPAGLNASLVSHTDAGGEQLLAGLGLGLIFGDGSRNPEAGNWRFAFVTVIVVGCLIAGVINGIRAVE